MYNFAMYMCQLGIMIYSLFNEKVRKMWRGEREAIQVIKNKIDPDAQYIWFHAASLGEFEQGRPLIEQIRRDHPHYKILLTFFSPSGYEVRKNYQGADIICYLPIDTVGNARKFLRTIRPVMAFFIKYEFWYNYLHILKHRNVPVYSVSSIFRPDQIFFKFYGRHYAGVLKCFTRLFVQNAISKELLAKIGITDVDIVGDTRFDRVLQIKAASKQLPIVDTFCQGTSQGNDNPLVFVAGSSWPPDEDIFIPYFNVHRNWKLIIAPHVIAEEHLKQIMSMLDGRKVIRYTQAALATEEELREAEVLIIDCFGLLSSVYHYGTVAYVGGGFGVGIHNVLEAAVWNMPVLFGPNNEHFREAQELKTAGGGIEISNKQDFMSAISQLESDTAYLKQCGKEAGNYVKSRSGATQVVLKAVGL